MSVLTREQKERAAIKAVAPNIGYGRTMQICQDLWKESLKKQNLPEGGAFAIGPCIGLTTPCGCTEGGCDWCRGSGWLTHKVKKLKTESESESE